MKDVVDIDLMILLFPSNQPFSEILAAEEFHAEKVNSLILVNFEDP